MRCEDQQLTSDIVSVPVGSQVDQEPPPISFMILAFARWDGAI